MDRAVADAVACRVSQEVAGNGAPAGPRLRTRVAGKFFRDGKQRLRARGVTYGPFAAGADGHPFPDPDRVGEDFARMAAAGINSVRTYHVPPEWLFLRAAEHGLALLVDVPWPKHLCFLD